MPRIRVCEVGLTDKVGKRWRVEQWSPGRIPMRRDSSAAAFDTRPYYEWRTMCLNEYAEQPMFSDRTVHNSRLIMVPDDEPVFNEYGEVAP
jgi:hypothetical protein